MKHKRRQPEQELHKATAELLDGLGWFWFHPANGGKRSRAEAAIMVSLGVKPGVADILIFESWAAPPAGGPGVAIEIKSPTGKLTALQRKWLCEAQRRRWMTAVCRSIDEVLSAIEFVEPLNGRKPIAAYRRPQIDPRQVDWTGGVE
jgi:hypothetical protein